MFIHILNKSTDNVSGLTIQIDPTNISLVDGSMSYMPFNADGSDTSWAALTQWQHVHDRYTGARLPCCLA